jgi:hypothetical protein
MRSLPPSILKLLLGLAPAVAACGSDSDSPAAPQTPAVGDRSLSSVLGATTDPAQQLSSLSALQLIPSASTQCCQTDECDPFPEGPLGEDDCPDPSLGEPGLWIPAWDPSTCSTGVLWDPDNDGVDNGCENALAQAFAPELVVTTADPNWDYSLNQPTGRLGGEYYFAVQEADGQFYGQLRIAYLPAYYSDYGARYDQFDLCLQFIGGAFWCQGHTGDSEFMLIDVHYDFGTYHWVADSIFLSAHCEQSTGNECQWYANPSVFEWRNDKPQGAPVVWVSEKKHANYPSQATCNSGVTFGICPLCTEFEHCEFNTIGQVFPVVYTQQNIGSRTTPLRDCAPAFWGSAETGGGWEECMWQAPLGLNRFNGWQYPMVNNGSAPYVHWLVFYAMF